MSFDDTTSLDEFGEAPLPEESNNNKTFMIAVGILGGIILMSVACLGGVYLFTRQSATATPLAEEANMAATQTAQAFIDESLTATFEVASFPTTTVTVPPTMTPPVAPPSPTHTPDPLAGLSGTQIAATATVGAAYTQAALALSFTPAPTIAVLPNGGFADDYGIPGLVVMALAFVIVILFARRLRTSSPG